MLVADRQERLSGNVQISVVAVEFMDEITRKSRDEKDNQRVDYRYKKMQLVSLGSDLRGKAVES